MRPSDDDAKLSACKGIATGIGGRQESNSMGGRSRRRHSERHRDVIQLPRSRSGRLFLGVLATAVVAVLTYPWWSNGDTDNALLPLSKPGPILCLVGGMAVKSDLRVETVQGPVFFCCPHCIEKFRADPSKYEAATRAQRRAHQAPADPCRAYGETGHMGSRTRAV